jgi:ribosomal protein S18 acetylase RimI-like enzyme
MSHANIRIARPQDAKSIAELLGQFDEDPANQRPSASMDEFLRDTGSEVVLVAEVGSILVGFLTLQITHSVSYTRPTAEVTAIFVRGNHRHSGIGSKLMDAAVRTAEDEGALELFLRVNAANVSAIRFYERCGLDRADHLEYRITYYGNHQR